MKVNISLLTWKYRIVFLKIELIGNIKMSHNKCRHEITNNTNNLPKSKTNHKLTLHRI